MNTFRFPTATEGAFGSLGFPSAPALAPAQARRPAGAASETGLRATAEWQAGSTRPVAAGRAVVHHVAQLRRHDGIPPDLVVRWNDMAAQPSTVDVVVHFHGYRDSPDRAMHLEGDKEPISGLDFAGPSGSGVRRTRPTVGLLPRGNTHPGSRLQSFPAIGSRQALDELIDIGLRQAAAAVGVGSLRRDRLILTAHSGGGTPLVRLLGDVDPDEVHLFDALYWANAPAVDQASQLARWVRKYVTTEQGNPGGREGALRVLYIPGTATQRWSRSVGAFVESLLASGPTSRVRLSARYRVDAVPGPHLDMARRFGWRLLADPATPVRGHGASPAPEGTARRPPAPEGTARRPPAPEGTARRPPAPSATPTLAPSPRPLPPVAVPRHLSGPAVGPMHSPPGTGVDPQLRRGVPADAILSPLSIAPRGLRGGSRRQPGTIVAIVVHNTSRGPVNCSKENGYRRPAIQYALDYYLNPRGKGFPHYVVDFNGTIYATCDERFVAWHAGWVHKGGAGLFRSGWTAPAWWSRVWSAHGAKTPIDLLPPRAKSPNYRTIGIELLILPNLAYTQAQYQALARLVVDIQRRNPDLRIPGAPSRALLGHEDFAPVTAEGGRADARGGWDPGAHRAGGSTPYFDWSRLWSEIQAVSPGPVARETNAFVPEFPAGFAAADPLHEFEVGEFDTAPFPASVEGRQADLGMGEVYKPTETEAADPGLDRSSRHPARAASSSEPTSRRREPVGPFGALTVDVPGWEFSYRFTAEDVIWTAKLIQLESGGQDDAQNQAVIWAMFNRYAFFTHRARAYRTFTAFIRAYSTTLQPVLVSVRAAAAHYGNPRSHYVPIPGAGYYPGTDIPRGQLARHLKFQEMPWDDIPAAARTLAERALRGHLENPGIGNASEFASTRIWWQRKNKTNREPTKEEWTRFTEQYTCSRERPCSWIGDVPGLDQRSNAFFLDRRVRDLPVNVVRVVPVR